MRVSSAVKWWDQSQLQVLVLASLAIQSFLAIFGPWRRHHIPPWLRFSIWLSFLGGDAVAIYALATLFNRQEVQVQQVSSAAHESHELEVFWTPILLMHLGGQASISAYNLEDNELWTRHIITSLSQITVAIYIFWKSWSSSADKSLLGAAILIFIPAILRCMYKPICLRKSSFSVRVHLNNILLRDKERYSNDEDLEEYIEEARAFIASPSPQSTKMTVNFFLYTDLARHYAVRLQNLKSFWSTEAYDTPQLELYRIFNKLYTKRSDTVFTRYLREMKLGFILHISPLLLLIVATVLFHTSNKQAYMARDIIVTLMLLYGTIIVELISSWSVRRFCTWHGMVAQYSLIELADYYYHNLRQMKSNKQEEHVQEELVLAYWSMEPCNSSESITSTVRGYVKLWWGEFITDAEHYREVSGFRGQWTLERNDLVVQLGWSLEKPFDESVLLWHIATDLCFHSSRPHQSRCKEISNYMTHLFLHKPDMLMTGSRNGLFMLALRELTNIMDEISWQGGALKIIEKVKIEESPNGEFIHDAKLLSQGLMDIGHDKMWEVVEGVWVEMLCFWGRQMPSALTHQEYWVRWGIPLVCMAHVGTRRNGVTPGEAL